MIKLIQIDGTELDLSISDKFNEFVDKGYSKSRLILEQFNSGKFPEIPKGKRFLDIGGNIGLFSIFVAPYYDQVVMLEPTEEHLEVARDLIEKLNLQNKITIIDKAYWPYSDVVAFNVGQLNSTMNSVTPCSQVHTNTIVVETTNLKTLITTYGNFDFIKMDIEGGENEVYNSDDFLWITKNPGSRLLMEVHSFPDLTLEGIKANLAIIKSYLETQKMKTISVNLDELYMKV